MKPNSFAALFIGVTIALLAANLPWANSLNLYSYDLLLGNTKAPDSTNNVVVIGVDDDALARFKDPLVLWHKYFAQVIDGVSKGGARAIAFDIIPSISLDKLAPELDRQLISAMRQADGKGTPVYLGFMAGENGQMPHRKFMFASSGLGFLNLSPGKDGKIRKQRLNLTNSKGRAVPSISLQMVKADLKEQPDRIYIDYRLGSPPVIPFGRVHDWARDGNTEKLETAFSNKMVIIGITSRKLPDSHVVPIKLQPDDRSRIPGVSIHAITANTLLAGKLLKDVPPWLVWSVAFVLSVISGVLFLAFSPWKAGAAVFMMLLATAAGVLAAFTSLWVVPAAPMVIGLVFPGAITGTYRYAMEYRQFRVLQRFFKSYVNPEIMKEIIENPGSVSFDGQHVIATVMFTDIRNFTSLSERIKPEEVVSGLNRYFTEMTGAVTQFDGYLNRYLGDGILAIFGAPSRLPDDGALAAVKCGMNMMERLEDLNKVGLFPNTDEVRIGIGVHTGEAIVGNIGCDEKMDYSIIGDTVNLAARIESVTKEYKAPLLVSESAYERVKDRVEARFVASTKVKGREKEVKLYEILSIKGELSHEISS